MQPPVSFFYLAKPNVMSKRSTESDKISALPGLRNFPGVQISGYASVNGKNCKKGTDESLFYQHGYGKVGELKTTGA